MFLIDWGDCPQADSEAAELLPIVYFKGFSSCVHTLSVHILQVLSWTSFFVIHNEEQNLLHICTLASHGITFMGRAYYLTLSVLGLLIFSYFIIHEQLYTSV